MAFLVQMPMDPLSELRDIHLPPPPPLWPPAPGWWLLAVAVLALAAVGIRLALLGWRRGRQRRAATRVLRRLRARYEGGEEAGTLAAELAIVLRRAAMSRHPRARVAGLTGRAWLEFLDDDAHQFTEGVGRHLATAPYSRAETVDMNALLALCEKWVKHNT
jgi:Domain of unknown function (DUF4381)